MAKYASTEQEIDAYIAGYREYQLAHHDRLVRCYDGVPEAVALLHERGHPLAVVTSKSDALAARGLSCVGLDRYFPTVITIDSSVRHKPHPEPVQIALERLGYAPAEAFFVGDSVHDIAAGNAAGVHTVAALWGPFTRDQLKPAGPASYLDSIAELPSLVARNDQG